MRASRPLPAALATLVAAGAIAAGASAAAVPNPCTVIAEAKVAAGVGLPGVTLTGVRSTRPDGPVKQVLCTYKHGAAEVDIYLSPHVQSGGSGGPPGMVISKPSGLGTGATFAYDLNPKYRFANVFFTKGAIDAGVHDNGMFPRGDVLAIARLLYAALP